MRPMKDSGIEWIGEIPEEWRIKRLINLAKDEPNSIVDGPFGSDLKNEEYVDFGTPIVQLNNINAYNHNLSNKVYISEKKAKALSRHIANSGDIVIAKMMPAGRACILKNDFEEYIVSADCIRFSLNNLYNSHFVLYSLNSYIIEEAGILSKGSTRQRINLSLVKKFRIIDLPLPEQTRIASFLDKKCTAIDAAIEKQRASIDKLKEYRQVVITNAVTKGLNPDVPMKDSGVEWIGEIPEGWYVKKLKLIANIYGRIGFRGYKTDDLVDSCEGALTLGATNIKDDSSLDLSSSKYISWDKYYESPEIMVNKGDIVIVQRGSCGRVGIINSDIGEATINPSLVIIKKLNIHNLFLFNYLKSSYIQEVFGSYISSTAVPMLSQEQIKNINICIPRSEEQHEIAAYLDKKCTVIDEAVAKKETLIEKLVEYKKSLIYEAVTGKIEVLELSA